MRTTLAFGRSGTRVSLPAHLHGQVLQARFARTLPAPDVAITSALQRPVSGLPLFELAAGKRSAVISICDITRPAPNRTVLPHVLASVERAGVPRSAIRILIATGLHRPATEPELREIVGPDILSRYPIDSHDARDSVGHADLGTTRSGTRVLIDRRFIDTDLRLSLGVIEPHLMLGFSGGRKLVAPGLAGEDTIKRLHSPAFMRHPKVVEGSFSDNPLHHELLEIGEMAGHDFIVDVALSRSRGIAGVFAGAPVEAHAAGVRFVCESSLARLAQTVDAVVTTCAGYPLDLTYYQSVKGATAAAHIVKEGGAILLMAACEEGLGGKEFRRLVRSFPDAQACLDGIANTAVTIDQWQLEKLALVALKARLSFCTPGIPPRDRSFLWGPVFHDPQQAIDALGRTLPPGATVAVIPDGPYVFAQLSQAGA